MFRLATKNKYQRAAMCGLPEQSGDFTAAVARLNSKRRLRGQAKRDGALARKSINRMLELIQATWKPAERRERTVQKNNHVCPPVYDSPGGEMEIEEL